MANGSAPRRFADKVVDKYLQRYAEPEAQLPLDIGRHTRALVVPVLREPATFLDGYRAAVSKAGGRTLCIVVVNQPEHASADTREANRTLLADLVGAGAVPLSGAPPIWYVPGAQLALLVVARLDRGFAIEPREGVGLARKMGSDLALRLFRNQQLDSVWIHGTDADATLPDDYFMLRPAGDSVALSYPFTHDAGDDPAVHAATIKVEIRLRYQVLGLAFAGSPYACHAVGSCLAVHAGAYAAVRGFPKRPAGEDFHLLRKLAKVGTVEVPDVAPLRIRSRRSDRVPFGTGPAAETLRAGHPFELDDPTCFARLATWLGWLRQSEPRAVSRDDFLARCPSGERPFWRSFCDELGLDAFVAALRARSLAEEPFRRQLLTWFDALACQKLVHRARDAGLPRLPFREALARAPFVPDAEHVARSDPFEIRSALWRAEQALPRRWGLG